MFSNKKIIAFALCVCMVIPVFVLFVSADGPENLFDKAVASKGVYVAEGNKKNNQSYSASDFIPVKANDKVYAGIIASDMPRGIPVFEFYDSSKKYLCNLKSNEVSFDKYSTKAAIASTAVPENAEFMRINLLTDNLDKFFVSCNEELGIEAYYTITGDEKPYVRFDSPLYGKKILFCGDSICDAAVEKNDPKYSTIAGWAGRIGTYNDMDWLNKGTSGASISNIRGTNTIIAQLKSQAIQGSSYDIVLLHGGVNDGWDNAPVGKMTDSFNSEDFDVSTFAGGLEYTIWYTKSKFKKAQIGYIINARTPAYGYGSLSNMTKYYDLAKNICDKWEVPYLDLYNDETLKNTTIPTCNNDNIHPTHDGYDILYPYIENFTESLVARQPVTPEPTETTAPCVSELPDTAMPTADPSGAPSTPVSTDNTQSGDDNNDDGSAIVFISAGAAIVLIAVVCATIFIIKKKHKLELDEKNSRRD